MRKNFVTTLDTNQIYFKIREILVDVLAVDEDEVTPESSLTRDLGAESIDHSDIVFKMEQRFQFKIPTEEDPFQQIGPHPGLDYRTGTYDETGMNFVRNKMGHFYNNLSAKDKNVFDRTRNQRHLIDSCNVKGLVVYIESKLTAKA